MQLKRQHALGLALAALVLSMQSADAAPKWTAEGAECVNEALEKKRSAIDTTTDCQLTVCKGLSGNAQQACAQDLYAAAEKGEPIAAGAAKSKPESKAESKSEPRAKPAAGSKQPKSK